MVRNVLFLLKMIVPTITKDSLLGTVKYNDALTAFLDMGSSPSQFPYIYKLSAVDSLGRESVKSPFLKTID